MIEIAMLHLFFSIFITNLSSNSLPYNTTIPGTNPLNFPKLITQNIPWFFPMLMMFGVLSVDYLLAIRKNFELKANFAVATLIYTMIAYAAVSGGIMDTGYFFFFEFLFILALFIISLLGKRSGP